MRRLFCPRRPARGTRVHVWDLPTRAFHWLLALAVAVAVVTGRTGGDWMRWHGIAGLCIVGLLAFRVVWGVAGGTHARFASFVPTPGKLRAQLRGRWRSAGHSPSGALSVLAMLGALSLQAGTGLFSNDEIAFTGPLAARVSDELSLRLTGLHHQLADVLLALLALHVAAILFYALRGKNLVTPMLTGVSGEEESLLPDPPRRGSWPALGAALLAAAAAVWLASGSFGLVSG